MPLRRALRWALPVPFLLIFLSCSPVRVVVWTNVPELAPTVELFNAAQTDHVLELVYEPALGSALRLAETPPDVVIGTAIEDAATAQLFESLDRIVRREIDADEFYGDLLAAGRRDDRQHLLPFAFNLPLVYFRRGVPQAGTPIAVTPSEMQERSAEFNRSSGDRAIAIAYSPVWEPSFLYQFLRVHGLRPHEAADGSPDWSDETLQSGINAARAWIDLHGGAAADRAFAEEYLYDPTIQLVRRGRIAYGYERSDRYFSLSDQRRAGLGFRWLGDGETIPVLEDVVYAGIPVGASSRRGAERFLIDLFTVERQIEIVESALRKRVDAFGVAGGFSALWRVNEVHLPERYPVLSSMIPTAAQLRFPPPSPRHWHAIVNEVVEPWLVREVLALPQSRDLETNVRAWLLQQED